MLDRPDVSLVVPLLDEAESLPELADQIRAALDGSGRTFEVWLIDDGSTDGSWGVVRDLSAADPRFAGVRLRRNYGKSAALAVGFERARGRYVVTLDAESRATLDHLCVVYDADAGDVVRHALHVAAVLHEQAAADGMVVPVGGYVTEAREAADETVLGR